VRQSAVEEGTMLEESLVTGAWGGLLLMLSCVAPRQPPTFGFAFKVVFVFP
jgi:hypothetical protein